MLQFEHRLLAQLPLDPNRDNHTRQVHGVCFSEVLPTPVRQPSLVAVAMDVATMLGFDEAYCHSEEFLQVFSGNRLLPGMQPVAACYGGHQFGNWAGQLGDGRAISLGEVRAPSGGHWELQLKGAGPTPYSRGADGRAVLRSSIREFLCSEAMYHLGIPTTRALSLVRTGEDVVRDMLYDGNPRAEPGAIVCRVAPSFVRFGNFEIFAARNDVTLLKRYLDTVIATYFPELGAPSPTTYVEFFRAVTERTADLIAGWMSVGFVHGVMNTDNMSILGLSIDYGPYGFLDDYSPDFTPNTTDAMMRRYRYGNQPGIALWNLLMLGHALVPVVGAPEPLEAILQAYPERYERTDLELFGKKLGLSSVTDGDRALKTELLEVLAAVETDMAIFFRGLGNLRVFDSDAPLTTEQLLAPVREAFYSPATIPEDHRLRLTEWLGRYAARIRVGAFGDDERKARMDRANPKYLLRNYVAQLAIDAAEAGDDSVVRRLLDILKRPFDEQPEHEEFAAKRPEWARNRVGCSMLSCSS
jgi:uncharacterized protein YdiU (UPF0061 family)